ncbi:hypothetical protein B0A54_04420 [Friedmanniomyces endolithicus]|uniref:Uncharacterized protein n=1 Tax=Friedmanniomyces endolithicus TaxID=329885 RepID=A0A4U0V919_9PEZI|nr:hypothetical protein B0A54_04420 [Friedmanniomyces endolithicus]
MPPTLTNGDTHSLAEPDADFDLGPPSPPSPPLSPSTLPLYIVLTQRPALAVSQDYTRGTAVHSAHLHARPAFRAARAFMASRGVSEGDLEWFGTEAGQEGLRTRSAVGGVRVRAWVERVEVDLEEGGVVGEGEGRRESGRVLGEVG